jgi:hypothetical protein
MHRLNLSSKSLRALARMKKHKCTAQFINTGKDDFIMITHKNDVDFLDVNDYLEQNLIRVAYNLETKGKIY